MQAPTHMLIGTLLQKGFAWRSYRAVSFTLLFLTGLLFHGIADKLALLTYHPAAAAFSDPFWLGYHLSVWLSSLVLLYLFWAEHKWGILFSVLPDMDWIFVHGQNLLESRLTFYREPLMHQGLNFFLDHVPPFKFLNLLPDCRYSPLAVTGEIGLVLLLLTMIGAIDRRRRNVHFR